MHDDARLLIQEARQQRLRAGDMDLHAHLPHGLDIRTCHAAVQDIAEDGDLQAFEAAFVLLDRKEVQQRLRRMRMGTVAGIQDDRAHDLGCILCRALSLMAHDDGIHAHRLDRVERVAQALALDDARRTRRDIHDIRAEIFTGQLERRTRARARLVEQRHNGFASQRRDLLDIPMDDVLHFLGRIQNQPDLLRGKIRQRENITASQG